RPKSGGLPEGILPMNSTEQTLQTGLQFHEAGRLDEARECYGKILQAEPEHPDARHLSGMLAYAEGDYERAVCEINRALVCKPANALYLTNLGSAYRALGHYDEARQAFERAILSQPGYADPHNNLGTVLFAQGKFTEARQSYETALSYKPDYPDAYVNLGSVHQALSEFEEAEAALRNALRLAPANPLAWNNLGNVFKGRDRFAEAVDCYQQALSCDPNYAPARNNLAVALQAQGQWEQAIEAFDASSSSQATAGLLIKRALALPVIVDSTEQLDRARARFDAELERLLSSGLSVADPYGEAGVCTFHLAYHGINDRDRYRRVAAMFSQACPSLNYVAPHCRAPRAARANGGKLRVGFISHFFYNHSVGRHYGGLIRHLARDRFHVVLLRFPGSDDEVACSLAVAADETVTLTPDLPQAREQIAGQALDVLYYTDVGMEPMTYFLAFARLAPVQCVTNGHPVTTGIPTLDYFVSCDAIEPVDAETHYSERLVRMRNIPNYYERPRLVGPRMSRRDFGLAPDWHVYLCTQNLCKLHPDFDQILGDILRRDPQGRVILFHGQEQIWSQRLISRIQKSIPDVADRVGFLDHQRNDQFLHLLTLADAVLDSTHFCGGTTTAQALAVGAPIVTLPGEFMRGRITYGCYKQMGLLDCVAQDAADYARIAVRLGTDPAFRARMRAAIFARNSVLYDNPGFVRELEEFFARAVAQQERRAA
ncbi:MAG TPA: tetratricopeptide repeat protein, partial [Planctomycetaceae bacterium]